MIALTLRGSLPEITDKSSQSESENKYIMLRRELSQLDTDIYCLKNNNYAETVGQEILVTDDDEDDHDYDDEQTESEEGLSCSLIESSIEKNFSIQNSGDILKLQEQILQGAKSQTSQRAYPPL